MKQNPSDTLSYEQTFQRLEAILEEMNTSDIELERSLTLFEEADRLMKSCQEKLAAAEKKVEIILKGKSGAPLVDTSGSVQTDPFTFSK